MSLTSRAIHGILERTTDDHTEIEHDHSNALECLRMIATEARERLTRAKATEENLVTAALQLVSIVFSDHVLTGSAAEKKATAQAGVSIIEEVFQMDIAIGPKMMTVTPRSTH